VPVAERRNGSNSRQPSSQGDRVGGGETAGELVLVAAFGVLDQLRCGGKPLLELPDWKAVKDRPADLVEPMRRPVERRNKVFRTDPANLL
jgi:hypothetical protein